MATTEQPTGTPPPKQDTEALAREIAQQINEAADEPVQQIQQIIETCGADFARQVLDDTLKAEAGEGIKTQDGKRRRTIGGAFFYIAKGRMDPDVRQRIFPNFGQGRKGAVLEWKNREQAITSIRDEAGYLRHVAIVLKGRPGKVFKHENSVVTLITHQHPNAPYPKGVPTPPSEPTMYTVYMGNKQWEQVEPLLKKYRRSPLIIEGTCSFDLETKSIAVFAVRVTTKELERQRMYAKSSKKGKREKSRGQRQKNRPALTAKGTQPARTSAKSSSNLKDTDEIPKVDLSKIESEQEGKQDEPNATDRKQVDATTTTADVSATKSPEPTPAAADATTNQQDPKAETVKASAEAETTTDANETTTKTKPASVKNEKTAEPAAPSPKSDKATETKPVSPAKSDSEKLDELNAAVEKLRGRITTMEQKDDQTGLATTKKLLKDTEEKISTLKKKIEREVK